METCLVIYDGWGLWRQELLSYENITLRLALNARRCVQAQISCSYSEGWEAAAAGLQPGQVILKVSGNNVNFSDYQDVLEHFSAQHTHQEPPETVRDTFTASVRHLKKNKKHVFTTTHFYCVSNMKCL